MRHGLPLLCVLGMLAACGFLPRPASQGVEIDCAEQPDRLQCQERYGSPYPNTGSDE